MSGLVHPGAVGHDAMCHSAEMFPWFTPERQIEMARDQYVRDAITIEDFEAQVARALSRTETKS